MIKQRQIPQGTPYAFDKLMYPGTEHKNLMSTVVTEVTNLAPYERDKGDSRFDYENLIKHFNGLNYRIQGLLFTAHSITKVPINLRPSLPEDQAGVIHAISPIWMKLCQIEGTTKQL